MKKYLLIVLLLAMMPAASIYGATAAKYSGYDVVNVTLNGSALTFDDVPPIIMDGRTLLPLRKVVESVNGIVSWDQATKTASVLKPHVNVVFTETTDGVNPKGAPQPVFPATTYEKILSYVSISNVPAGTYNVYVGIYKTDSATGVMNLVEGKSAADRVVTKQNVPVMFSTTWTKATILQSGAGLYSFVVTFKDSSGKYQPVAVYYMDYTQ
jgi:hypothetical protein